MTMEAPFCVQEAQPHSGAQMRASSSTAKWGALPDGCASSLLATSVPQFSRSRLQTRGLLPTQHICMCTLPTSKMAQEVPYVPIQAPSHPTSLPCPQALSRPLSHDE